MHHRHANAPPIPSHLLTKWLMLMKVSTWGNHWQTRSTGQHWPYVFVGIHAEFFTAVLPSCVYDTPWILEPTLSPRLYGHPEAAEQAYRTVPPHPDPQSAIRGPTAALILTLTWIHITIINVFSKKKKNTWHSLFPEFQLLSEEKHLCGVKFHQ